MSAAGASPVAPSHITVSFPAFNAPVTVSWVDRVKREPLAFGFLALTVGALSLGLRSLHNNDKRQSQLMMRARVFFQFCTVSALLGNIYYRASQGEMRGGRVEQGSRKNINNHSNSKGLPTFRCAKV